jgi:FlaA1/EpsC-like NDP-sugar epimerase
MLTNGLWAMKPVVFLDDDAVKQQRRVLGIAVKGPYHALDTLLTKYQVEEVLLSSPSINGTREQHVRQVCEARQVPVRRLFLEIR